MMRKCLQSTDNANTATVLHWFLATTDAGPNELGARRIVHADVKDMSHVLFTDTTCLEHSQHLVALSSLKEADKCLASQCDWRYYASLATCSNVCRDVGQQLFAEWSESFGVLSAKKTVKTLWPKACSGRWSGCDKPEARFLQCGKDKLSTVMSKILSKGKPQKKSENSQSVSIDELAIEESKAYSEKLSRWKKRTKQCLEDPLWWRVLETMHEARGPLAHLSHFLHQKQQGQFNHVATLCTGKASTIFEEFLEVWPKLVKSGCLIGSDDESQFIRNFANLAH